MDFIIFLLYYMQSMASQPTEMLLHTDRPAYLSDLVVPSAHIIKPLIDGLEPTDLDLDAIAKKAREFGGLDNGVQEAYYAGLYAWKELRERLDDRDLGGIFVDGAATALENYTFRERPASNVDAQLQSSLTTPAIALAWLAVAPAVTSNDPSRLMWTAYHDVPREKIIDVLQSEWFPKILREASKTNSGLYRNSTGYKMDYRRFITRSIHGTLRMYHDAQPDGAFPIDIPEEIGDPKLSDDFVDFLAERLRNHNRQVQKLDEDTPLHEGTSRGCPFSASAHFVTNHALMTEDIGHTTESTVGNEKKKIVLDWDPYSAACNTVANVLLNLELS